MDTAAIIHCPRAYRWPDRKNLKWERYVWRFFRTAPGTCTDSADLTFITYNTSGTPGLLERSAEHLGLSTPVVLGTQLTSAEWRWAHKVSLVRDYLASGQCTTKYVACLDSDDVLVRDDPRKIVENFSAASCEMLFCRGGNWPPSAATNFEVAINAHSDAPPSLRSLNANFIGRTEYVLARLEEMMPLTQVPDPTTWFASDSKAAKRAGKTGYDFSDQLAWRNVHMYEHPNIQVDVEQAVLAEFTNWRAPLLRRRKRVPAQITDPVIVYIHDQMERRGHLNGMG